MRFVRIRLLIVSTALVASSARGEKPHNIFDDDWTPPKVTVTPRPPAPSHSTSPTSGDHAPSEIAPTTPNKDPAPAPVMPDARRAIPANAQQAVVRKMMKEVFAEQLVDQSVSGRREFCKVLINRAEKSADAPVDQFVLLVAAEDAAIDAANLPLAFGAADRLARVFDVDGLTLKAEATIRLGAKANSPELLKQNIHSVLALTEQLADVNDYLSASRVCTAIQPATAGHAELRAQVQQRQREISLARDAAEKIIHDEEKLKKFPDDPAANLAVGRYLVSFKGDWEGALPMLAKGSDTVLKGLAVQEMGKPATAEAMVKLADGWWNVASRQTDIGARARMTSHAVELYKQSVSEITGLRKLQIEKRIEDAVASAAENKTNWTELLTHMTGKASGTQQGVVTIKEGDRISTAASYKTPVAFRIVAQTDSTNIRMAYACDDLIFNWEGNGTELRIDGGPAGGRHKAGAGEVPTDTWVTIDLVAKPDSMTISVDGKERHSIKADFSKIDQRLSIFQHSGSTVMVKSVQMSTPDE